MTISTKPKHRILVCGGRDFGCLPRNVFKGDPTYQYHCKRIARDIALFERVMAKAMERYDIELIIEGGARGADRLAHNWAKKQGLDWAQYPALWNVHKNRAGPIRNQLMLDEGRPTKVIAFPGGAGTADMVRRSKGAGIKVIEVK